MLLNNFYISILAHDIGWQPLYKHASDEGEQKLTTWTDGPIIWCLIAPTRDTNKYINRNHLSLLPPRYSIVSIRQFPSLLSLLS